MCLLGQEPDIEPVLKWYRERLDDAIAHGAVYRTSHKNVRTTACLVCGGVVPVATGYPVKFERRRIGTACGSCSKAFPTAVEARKRRVKREKGSSRSQSPHCAHQLVRQ